MKKGLIYGLLIVVVILAVLPALIYIFSFRNATLSNDNLNWAQFGTYLGGTLTPVIALTGVVLTFTLGMVSHRHNQTLLKKQEREKRPLANVGYVDREERIEVNLHNKGLGPMLITKYIIKDIQGIEKSSMYDWIQTVPCEFGNYTSNLDSHVLRDGGEINLIKLKGDINNNEFTKNRDNIRNILGKLEVIVEYKDIYDNQMPQYKRSLKWFSRHEDEHISMK